MPLPLHGSKGGRSHVFKVSIARSRSMPLPLQWGRWHKSLRNMFQSLGRAQCLCHVIGVVVRSPTGSFNRSVALNASATEQKSFLTGAIAPFQSLGRAQCLCHHLLAIFSLLLFCLSFNRSVALNASATSIIPRHCCFHCLSFNRSVALNASATIC